MPSMMNLKKPLLLASVVVSSAADPRRHGIGANFLQSAAVHPTSGDMLLLTDPGNSAGKPVSVAAIPSGTPPGSNFSALPSVDNGSVAAYPTDLAFFGNSAFVVDQGEEGIVAFNRSSSGEWKFWKKWLLKNLLPDCDAQSRQFGQPEAIVAAGNGTFYVSMSMRQLKRCLTHPFTRCCESAGSSTAVMRFDVSPDGAASMKEVFHSSSFFKLEDGEDMHYHIRGMDVTENGDIIVVGYGDVGTCFGHTAWRWNVQESKAQLVAGQRQGPGGAGGDGGDATAALLDLPWGVVALSNGLYISEAGSSDVRGVFGGRISTCKNAPHNKSAYDNMWFRKLHRGRAPNSLLLAVTGLGSNEGHVVEFDLGASDAVVLV